MRCRIADLIVELTAAGGMASRCADYRTNGDEPADVVIRSEEFLDFSLYGGDAEVATYFETGVLFYRELLRFGGLMLHSSAVAYEGKAYLFSGPSGVGKSTHTKLWQACFGEEAQMINDDKPALRFLDGRWYAYGTPWCGKDGINQNVKIPLGGICFLKQGEENRIRRLTAQEAVPLLYMQTNFSLKKKENMHYLLSSVDTLVQQIPIYELENKPEPAAAMLSMTTMKQAAMEAGL